MGALAAARDNARVRVRKLSARVDETAVIGARRDAALRRGATELLAALGARNAARRERGVALSERDDAASAASVAEQVLARCS